MPNPLPFDEEGGDTGHIPLNEPPVRVWELNENSTHYDRLVAAPSDGEIQIIWTVWSTIALTTAVFATGILIPLLLSKAIRKNPFNLYLVFLIVPDLLFCSLCAFTCLQNSLMDAYSSEGMCRFQSFYVAFGICANSNLNALVARQLYNMLSAASRFRRYKPPTHKRVVLESLAVYLYSALVALMGIWDAPRWPLQSRLVVGAACLPMNDDTASTVFFYCVFFPLLFGIPFAYVCWAAYRIWRENLLPQTGRRRILAIYFFRLAAVFVVMWVPGLLFMFVGGVFENPWIQVVGGSWSHLQAAVSGLVCLLKPDIWKAVKGFWTCDLKSEQINTEGGRQANSSSNNSIFNAQSTTDVITVISAVSSRIRSISVEHSSGLMRKQSSFFSSLFMTSAQRAKLERQEATRQIEEYLKQETSKRALEQSPEYWPDETSDLELGNTAAQAQEGAHHDSCSDVSSMEEDPTRDVGDMSSATINRRFHSDTAATGKIGLMISVVRDPLAQSMPNLEWNENDPDLGGTPLPTITERVGDTAAAGKVALTRDSLTQSMPNLEWNENNPDLG